MLTKVCTRCRVEKPNDASTFRLNKNTRSGLDSWCRACAKEYRTERRSRVPDKSWGIPTHEHERYKEAKASDVCVICGSAAQVVDHEHVTGRIRGALCQRCNMGLGHFRDDPELLELAALYLRGQCACGKCEVLWGGTPSDIEQVSF